MDKKWYAIKVFFNKVFRMEDILSDMELETYLPVQKEKLKGHEYLKVSKMLSLVDGNHRKDSRYIQEGSLLFERKPLVTSLIFVRATDSEIGAVDARLKKELLMGRMLGFIYKTADFKRWATIPDKQMDSFRVLTENGGDGLTFFTSDLVKLAQGDRVRVIDGPLKGAEGYIKRIKKDRRLLVCVEGVIAVASSYIPDKMLEKITE
jgi:transcription antitermination factor NusG